MNNDDRKGYVELIGHQTINMGNARETFTWIAQWNGIHGSGSDNPGVPREDARKTGEEWICDQVQQTCEES